MPNVGHLTLLGRYVLRHRDTCGRSCHYHIVTMIEVYKSTKRQLDQWPPMDFTHGTFSIPNKIYVSAMKMEYGILCFYFTLVAHCHAQFLKTNKKKVPREIPHISRHKKALFCTFLPNSRLSVIPRIGVRTHNNTFPKLSPWRRNNLKRLQELVISCLAASSHMARWNRCAFFSTIPTLCELYLLAIIIRY